MSFVVAVDSGGTFSDCVVLDERGRATRAKAPSTPPNFEEGVLASVGEAAKQLEIELEHLFRQTSLFAHGTTLATNILITRTGAKTALLTTRGHEDAILIGRTVQKVAGLTESEIIDVARLAKPDPLVPRSRIHGINERMDRNGESVVPLQLERLGDLTERLRADGVEAIAISFLWSFLNPEHERSLHAFLENGTGNGWFVTTSSDVAPVIREYERTSTTVLNAYLSPAVKAYLDRMRDRLREAGHGGAVSVMHSAGGVWSIDEARERGVTLLSSGPAGGLLGARTLAQQLGVDRAIATDVGGTSFDVGLIVDGELSYAEAPVFAKYPVTVPVIDVTSIGAGGGSIAWIERETGILRVGPQSAGASPGPVCYGVGGDQPTVTDANLVLGRLNPDNFLGGRMKLDAGRARNALADRIGDRLGMSLEAAAAAIIRIVDSQMADLIRKVTVERGLDPASFTVLSYGGAGGLHVGTFAAKLRSRHVVIPLGAAVFSAIGIARSDVKRVAMTSDPMRAPFDLRQWQRRFEELDSRLERELREEQLPTEQLVLRRFVDLQFRGQVHTVRVPLDHADLRAEDGGEKVIERFTGLYETKYGRGTAFRKAGVELMTFIVEATATLPVPRPEPQPLESSDATAALRGSRPVFLHEAGEFVPVAIYDADALRPGNELAGPAVLEAEDTTILLHPEQRLRVDGYLNLRLELGGD
jgi:N-methylhydantoinase A